MAQPINERLLSVEEYFALLDTSLDKYEYYRGRIYQLSGGSPEHAIISGNTITALNNALDDKDCQVYSSDVLIQVQTKSHYTFADATVVCGQPQYEQVKNNRFLINPGLIVEVLSHSTGNYDRGAKFQLYKAIPSFQDYLLVDSRKIYVQHYRKLDSNTWQEKTYTKLEDVINLENFGVDLKVADIYKRIKIEPEAEFVV
jgi:Uma2 family endonuclease